jgi:hypothetical protein
MTNLDNALAKPEYLIEVANIFSEIADALHHALRGLSDKDKVSSEKIFALITEEYGLRTRLGILKGDRFNRSVVGVAISQESLIKLLYGIPKLLSKIQSLDALASLINSISVLCVSIFPGKHKVINFLINELTELIETFQK